MSRKIEGDSQTQASLLPKGFYSFEGDTIRIKQGNYAGVSFRLGVIKIREEFLTQIPQLLYDYTIIDNASFDATLLRSDPKLSRIIGAIIVEELSKGGQFNEANGTTKT